jgi:outer membrane protein OmpA-like peptidoglycan-associated protein
VYKQLGDCYYNVFNSVEAEKWYSKAVEKEQDAETYFRYAQMLKANTKYDLANVQMKKFATLSPNDNRTKFITVDENYITKLLGTTKTFDVKAAGFNTKYSEFGAYLKDNFLYFASARNTDRKTYDWNDQPFLDIYKIDYNEGAFAKEAVAVDDLNTKHHEGAVTISPDGNTIYFSRESFFEKEFEKVKTNNKKVSKMYIYKATKDGDKWANITSLEINNSKYNNSSPSLSKDGKTLYFSSDMPGGIGKSDVWKMTIAADGKLGKPENLGKTINTEGSEMFPFIADDETLYFSSNGRNGLGGLDVYSYNIKKNAEPINIGKPVNSEKDDFGFTFNQAKNIAFLSSNRNGGAGDDDIYIATPLCIVDLTVVVRDKKTTATISDAKITVVDQNKALLGTGISNQLGKALFQAECDKPYFLNVEKEGYVSQVFELANSKGEVTLTADLEPTVAIVAEKEIILSDVNFEYNKSNITQEGAFELNKLLEVLNQNPEMVILCKSHTDSRGNDNYNMSLSNRRAKSTVQYLISKGIAVERISGEGFGESEPKVPCGKDCTEDDHAKNRRSEFIIVKK